MSKRDFGTIKSLLHFDYPYFNEPGDGLDDEAGLETWTKLGGAVLHGAVIPKAGTFTPKFGYRCLYAKGAAIGTNTTGIWNLNSSGKYEIEFFVYPVSHGGNPDSDIRNLFRLWLVEDNISWLRLRLTPSGTLELQAPGWGISDVLTGTTVLSAGAWHHVLLRIRDQKISIFIDGVEDEDLTAELPQNVINETSVARVGQFDNTSYPFYMDEFVFRHSAGSGNPTIPTEPYGGVLKLSEIGGYGDGSEGDVTLSSSEPINCFGTITSITDSKTFSCSSVIPSKGMNDAGNDAFFNAVRQGKEVMLHLVRKNTDNLTGFYAFAHIVKGGARGSMTSSWQGDVYTFYIDNMILDEEITTENGYDFTLSNDLLSAYTINLYTVPNYNTLTINSGVTVTPSGGGIVVFRCKGDCTINGSIITSGMGTVRSDAIQMTHSKLVDRFLCSRGGGVYIVCGGTFTAPSTARIGATWSGLGDGSNGAAGYGGKGGNVNPSATVSGIGGAGGVGGGGGGAACISASTNAGYVVNGGACGSAGVSGRSGSGGGGCGGSGGEGTQYMGGAGGGSQSGNGGTHGTDKTTTSTSIGQTSAGNGTINGGNYGTWNTNKNSSTSYVYYCSGAGGGGAGGNGGDGYTFKNVSTRAVIPGGAGGACVVLVCDTLNADNAAISTGGAAGTTNDFTSGYTKIGGSGGGGTGFCYISCRKRV